MIQFYNGDFADGHSYVAKLCFPNELAEIELKNIKKERPDLRSKAKSAKFAINKDLFVLTYYIVICRIVYYEIQSKLYRKVYSK